MNAVAHSSFQIIQAQALPTRCRRQTMSTRDIFVVSAARTAIGTFGGSLKDVPNAQLATTVVKAAIARAGIAADTVGHVVMGNVIPTDTRDAYLSRVAVTPAAPSKPRPSTSTACAALACRPSSRQRNRLRWATAKWPLAPAPNP
jgi:3-oxoacyl-[acyl-carrier-protein] synthase III